jgi:excisionase family DNA binding protein
VALDITATGSRRHAAGTASTLAEQLVMHTVEEAARLLKVKRSWLERQAAARKIPFSMLGGSYRFSDRHLAEIVRMNEMTPVPATLDDPQTSRTGRKERPGGEVTARISPLRPRSRNGPRST